MRFNWLNGLEHWFAAQLEIRAQLRLSAFL